MQNLLAAPRACKRQLRPCFVYLIVADRPHSKYDLYKVGISHNPASRLRQIATSCPYGLHLAAIYRYPDFASALHVEQLFHRRNFRWKKSGEWFEFYATGAMCELSSQALEFWLIKKGIPLFTAPSFLRSVGMDDEMIDLTIASEYGIEALAECR